jgi:hypothetical protein
MIQTIRAYRVLRLRSQLERQVPRVPSRMVSVATARVLVQPELDN